MRRKIVIVLTILITFLLQSTVFPFFTITSVIPNLLLILTVSFGFMQGKTEGLFVGFFCGLLIDLFYGNLFGFYALVYMYIGYLNGFLCKIYYDEDVKVPMLLVAVSDVAYNIVIYSLQFLLRGRLDFSFYMKNIMLPEAIYTVVITILFYRIFHIINHRLVKEEMEGQRSLWLRK